MSWYQHRAFPAAYDFLMGMGRLDARREESLKPVRGRILEIGIGTGRNLPFYPADIDRIAGVDSNPGMLRQLERKRARSAIELELHHASADEMPFPDASFDTVVSTHVLCSLPNRPKALAEIQRVLRPNGRFVFLEHGLSPDAAVAKWQRRLNVVQKRFAVGCLLDVPVKDELESAGFSFESLRMGYQEKESKTHSYLYEGVALPLHKG
ncbi:class I SAM-dependent methyltransferase [Haloferula sp.]|uniref:class I SAM-dependent methyltransferase n=1 Tax=Haloferula sp. TaxID=2497595 RepID=UPI00329E9D4C